MNAKITFDTDLVLPFVQAQVPLARSADMRAIGLERDGGLVAGVIYEGCSGHNIWGHVAAVPGARWLNRAYLTACFAYPFLQLGVQRITGYVEARNQRAREFDENLGFRQEATLRGAASDGGDVILYVMWRHECRFIRGL